jgi:acyl dehydratase
VATPPVRTLALLRVNVWHFQLPVFAGDTLRVVSRVVEKTPRGRGRRGEVVWYRGVVNQDGKTVQEGEVVTLIECRPLPRARAAAEAEAPAASAQPSPNGMA